MIRDYVKNGSVDTVKNYKGDFKITEYGLAVNQKGRYRLPKRGYITLARAIYEDKNPSVPDGFEIHHIDGDRSNDDIDNLIALSHEDHVKMHMAIANKATKTIRGVMNEQQK